MKIEREREKEGSREGGGGGRREKGEIVKSFWGLFFLVVTHILVVRVLSGTIERSLISHFTWPT